MKSLSEILKDYFQNSDEPLAVEFRKYIAEKVQADLTAVKDPVCVDSSKTLKDPVNTETQLIEAPNTSLEDWIDGQIVMQTLHISPRTLQTLRSNGTLPFSRIGNKLYYRRQDVKKILSDNYIMYKLRNHGK